MYGVLEDYQIQQSRKSKLNVGMKSNDSIAYRAIETEDNGNNNNNCNKQSLM